MTINEKLNYLEKCGYGPSVMKRTRICLNCKAVVSEGYVICPECKASLPDKTLYDSYRERHMCCDSCGTVLTSDSLYCSHCGKKLHSKAANEA